MSLKSFHNRIELGEGHTPVQEVATRVGVTHEVATHVGVVTREVVDLHSKIISIMELMHPQKIKTKVAIRQTIITSHEEGTNRGINILHNHVVGETNEGAGRLEEVTNQDNKIGIGLTMTDKVVNKRL